MLEPHSRALLLDALRPPEGFALDCGIGTTYSMDLLALLTAPLAFTLFDTQEEGEHQKVNTLEVLESLRRYADRLTIFCHAGRIAMPAGQYPQFAYLEAAVIECLPPGRSDAFHPKVWLLRFTDAKGAVVYRLLCLSRNLTFDRSWDTVLSLEGQLLDRKNGIAANRPLGDFIKALPGLAVREVSGAVQARIDQLQDEVRRVDFLAPEGFEEFRFWPIGIEGYRRWPFSDGIDRLLIISPFVTEGCLKRLAGEYTGNILVSRVEQVAAAGKALDCFAEVYVLSDQAEPETEPDEADNTTSPGGLGVLSGLHAKCYVGDAGWKARVWTGSANATEAAFSKNVEFLVELVGPKSKFGTQALLQTEKGTTRLRDLLEPYRPPVKPDVPDEVARALEEAINTTRQALAEAQLCAKVERLEASDQYSLTVATRSGGAVMIPEKVAVRCWPVTLKDSHAVSAARDSGTLATFPLLSFEALTAFCAFEVTAQQGGQSVSTRFVLTLPPVGGPNDRRERLLRSMLRDSRDVVRFLLLILTDEGVEAGGFIGPMLREAQGDGAQFTSVFGPALLEALVRTLDRAPDRLDYVAQLVEDLRKGEDNRPLLPPQFDEIWRPIWAARERLRS
jgi:hypothetical protein